MPVTTGTNLGSPTSNLTLLYVLFVWVCLGFIMSDLGYCRSFLSYHSGNEYKDHFWLCSKLWWTTIEFSEIRNPCFSSTWGKFPWPPYFRMITPLALLVPLPHPMCLKIMNLILMDICFPELWDEMWSCIGGGGETSKAVLFILNIVTLLHSGFF